MSYSLPSSFSASSLSSFVIFTPKDVPEGQEDQKILYYYPSSDSLDTKNKLVGLGEALVNFTRFIIMYDSK